MSALAVATGPADREMDDLDLVAAVRAGDDRAFETLFLRYQPRIAAYVGGTVRDHGRAEDITQEVFMSALRRLREDDAREIHFRPWIYEIAKNKCIDAYRRGRNRTEVSFDAHDQLGAAEHDRLAEPGSTPDSAVEGKLAFDNLRGAFGGLSPVHHDILVMREFEGLSYREIGERLGMSRAAVESTLFRARKRLGEEYEELVSGKRCLRVQRIVGDTGLRAAGLRDQRRVARHLAHCQPCRRHAHLAGADVVDLVRPAASPAARVAAFLPLPAFLRRRSGGGEEVAQLLSQPAIRPIGHWTAQVAQTIDPGTMSGWAKVAVTAATVAIAGGSAIQHRAPAAPSAPAAGVAERESSRAALRATNGSAPAGSPGHAVDPSDGAAPAAADAGRSPTHATPSPGAPDATSAQPPASGADAGRRGLQHSPDGTAPAPLGPVHGAAQQQLAPVTDAVGGTARGAVSPVAPDTDRPRRTVPEPPDRLVGDVVAPVGGVARSGRDAARGTNGAVGDTDAAAKDAAPTEDAANVQPRVPDLLANPTPAPKHLGR